MKITQVIMGLFLSASIQQIDANGIVGKWITVDDKTGFSRGDVLITKNEQGVYSGKITAIRPVPGRQSTGICQNCTGALKNKPLVGMQVIYDFVQHPTKPDEYIHGKALDPLSGNTYKGKIKISANGKRITLRGYVGTSLLGRNQTWVRAN